MQMVKYLPGLLLCIIIVLSIFRKKANIPNWLIITATVVSVLIIFIATMLIMSKK